MKTEDFYSVEEIEKAIANRKILETGEKADWLNTREIKIKKTEPYSIFFKHSHSDNEDFKELKIKKRAKGNRLSKLTGNFDTKLKILHPKGKPISEKKLTDIQSLMSLVPDEFKSFFTTNLDQTADFEDDLPIIFFK